MAEPSNKRRKVEGSRPPRHQQEVSKITDPRFTRLQSDPRYRLPSKRNAGKVKLDKRFGKVIREDDFVRKAKVDRYGRPISRARDRIRLENRFELEDEDEDETDDDDSQARPGATAFDDGSVDDDDEVRGELARVDRTRDPLRQGKYDSDVSSSDDESSSSSDEEDESAANDGADLPDLGTSDIPVGEVTSRIAVVNLDWDNISAADLMAVFSSFLPASERLEKASIYPSEFGKERMEREQMEGPPKEIFASLQQGDHGANLDSGDELDESEEAIKSSLIKANGEEDLTDFNSAALRNYQLSRLRYFYAILTFSSADASKIVYDACDGAEYLSSANFFDLRFVPDDTDFSSDKPREECTDFPANYQPSDFVTDALQHSKVKLTWDAEDKGKRQEAAARAFRSGKEKRQEIDESDLKAYIGSDSSDNDDEDGENDTNGLLLSKVTEHNEEEAQPSGLSRKDQERQRRRALLGLAPEPAPKSKSDKSDKRPVGNLQITFSAALSTVDHNKDQSVFENNPEDLIEETTAEKYVRKERERKAKRRERIKAAREGNVIRVAEDEDGHASKKKQSQSAQEPEEDLGFDDPFFAAPDSLSTTKQAQLEKQSSRKILKEERLRKREAREKDEAAQQKDREKLALLMDDDMLMEDNDDGGADYSKIQDDSGKGKGAPSSRHFDMADIDRQERRARKAEKKNKNKKSKLTATATDNNSDEDTTVKSDPRFSQLFSSHEYAIDPTSKSLRKDSQFMKGVLEDVGKRRQNGGR